MLLIILAVNCQFSNWSEYGPCSHTCGNHGTKQRTRKILAPAKNGGECQGDVNIAKCNVGPCAVNCQLSNWSEYGPCSHTCGNHGTKQRTRKILAPAKNGGECQGDVRDIAQYL